MVGWLACLLACFARGRGFPFLFLFEKSHTRTKILLRSMVSYYDMVKSCVCVKWRKEGGEGGASALSQNRRIATTILSVSCRTRLGQQCRQPGP